MLKQCLLIAAMMMSGYSLAQNSPGDVLDQYHQSAASADYDAYFATIDENAILLGTDGSERWTKEAFKGYVKPYFNQGRGWTYKVIQRNLTTVKADEVMFFDELLYNESYGNCRGAGVLVKTNDGWKILQYNLSVVVPNDISSSVVTTIKKFRQLTP